MRQWLYDQILRRAPKRRGPYVIAGNEFGLYCLPRKGLARPACQAILRDQVWEPRTLRFLCDNAHGDIIHAGTFFGDFLPALSGYYSRVWAFEPNADSFKCAEVTATLNNLPNVTIKNVALGREFASLDLCTTRNGHYLGGGSFIVEQPGCTRVVPIDASVPSDTHIGVIHLDVEGYEGPVLDGARETIRRCNPVLVLESIPDIVRELGYDEVQSFEHNHVFRRG